MDLGKRKRIDDDDESVNTGCKRRKICTNYKSMSGSNSTQRINAFIAINVPTPKPPYFDLFRLPAEIRNHILHYAYGGLVVHVGLESLNKLAQASHKDLTYTVRRTPTYPFHTTPFRLPPFVSKQFYAEATAEFYATSSFSFSEPHCFRAFALSPHACVSRLQRLRIPRLTSHWNDALVSSLVGRLTSLRGVRLTHRYWQCYKDRPVPCATDPSWKGFWRIICAFQQHELDAKQTRFKVTVYNAFKNALTQGPYVKENILGPGEVFYEDMIKLQQDLTEGLLMHSPRRLSRRVALKR